MNMLVTGGAGFIGSNFIHYLYKKDSEVNIRVLDKLTYSASLSNLEEFKNRKGFEFIEGDICDSSIVKESMQGVNIVVNFAAEVAVDRSISDQEAFLQTDIIGVYRLLNEARKQKTLEKFIQISTDEVYGQIIEGSFKEDSELKPRNPYAASKLGGERIAYSFYETYQLPVVITRASNTYGPRAHLEKVIPLFITNLFDGQKVPLYGDGNQIREWLFVEDHCSAIYHLIKNGVEGEVYNVGGGQELSNLKLAKQIISAMGKDISFIKYVKDRPGHDYRYSLNCDKLQNLGWKNQFSFCEGLYKTICWYKDNEKWWRTIKNRLDDKYISGYWGGKE